MGKVLAHSVHLGMFVWACAAAFALLFYLVVMAVDFDPVVMAWVWAGAGVVKFFMVNAFDRHMVDIMHGQITLNLPSSADQDPESKPLVNDNGDGTGGDLPPWCRIDMDAYSKSRSCLKKALTKDFQPNRQDALHWFEREGPEYNILIFQCSLISTAIYGAVLLLTFLPLMHAHGSPGALALYCVVSTAPVVVSQRQWRNIAVHMTQANCVGTHRKPQSVGEVQTEAKTARAVRAFLVVNKLLYAAKNGLLAGCMHGSKSDQAPKRGSVRTQSYFQNRRITDSEDPVLALSAVDRAEIEDSFRGFSTDGSGRITSKELNKIMVAVGACLTPETIGKIIDLIDEDGDGEIDKDEFLNFYARNIHYSRDERSREDRARDMFAMFDESKDGEITIGEFKATLDAFDYGFTMDEVGALVRELDADESGTVTMHEFEHLLRKFDAQLAPHSPRDLPVA